MKESLDCKLSTFSPDIGGLKALDGRRGLLGMIPA